MKTAQDPRHRKRQDIVKKLFSFSFSEDQRPKSIEPILDNLEIIDKAIQDAATERPLKNINKIDLAILRLATHEITFDKSIPTKVTIDEAIEIAKSYGSDSSPSFVNGVLATIAKKDQK